MTARDSVDGRSSRPLTAGSAMCADIATRAPAATAARNGTNSRASRLAREEPTGRDAVVRVVGRLARRPGSA